MSFQEQFKAEFVQSYVDFRRFQFLTLIRKLENDMYVGIYGKEPPE